jgi:hypothetical protein
MRKSIITPDGQSSETCSASGYRPTARLALGAAIALYCFYAVLAVQDIIYTIPAPDPPFEITVKQDTWSLKAMPIVGFFVVHWGEVALSTFALATLCLYLYFRGQPIDRMKRKPGRKVRKAHASPPTIFYASLIITCFELGLAGFSPETMPEHVTNFILFLSNAEVLGLSALLLIGSGVYILLKT